MVSAVSGGGLSLEARMARKGAKPARICLRGTSLDRPTPSLLEWRDQKGAPGEGKRVQVPRGPAAVTGYETRRRHWPHPSLPKFWGGKGGGWEGAGSRGKPEARKPAWNHRPSFPSWAGEGARVKTRVQSSGSFLGLEDFFYFEQTSDGGRAARGKTYRTTDPVFRPVGGFVRAVVRECRSEG